MPTFTLDRAQMRTALSHHLPVVKRNVDGYLPALANIQFHVIDGTVTMLSTDRYIIAATPLQVDDMEDKRRVAVALDHGQLRLLRAWLTYVAPNQITVRVTDVGVTFCTQGTWNNDLLLRDNTLPDELIDLRGMLQQHFNLGKVATTPSAAKAWRPDLISHIQNAELWATGGDMEPGMFRAGNTYGIIMPIALGVADSAAGILRNNAELFGTAEQAPDNVVQHPYSTGKE